MRFVSAQGSKVREAQYGGYVEAVRPEPIGFMYTQKSKHSSGFCYVLKGSHALLLAKLLTSTPPPGSCQPFPTMDAGASIIAFATIGLQSVKVVYDTISAIKDGPSKLRDLQGVVGNLQTLLEEMKQHPGLMTSLMTTSSLLLPLIKRCVEDIQRFEAKIGKLALTPTEAYTGKVWKRLKMVFQEKDIPYMISVVTGHLSALNLHCDLRIARALKDIDSQQFKVQDDVNNLARKFAATSISSSTAQANMMAGQSKTHHMLNTVMPDVAMIPNLLAAQINMISDQAQTHRRLDTMAPGVAAISSLAAAQVETVNGMSELKQMLQQIILTTTVDQFSQQIAVKENPSDPDMAHALDTTLSNQLDQLRDMLGEERYTINTSDAQEVVELIEEVVDLVKTDCLAPSIRGPSYASEMRSLARDLKQLVATIAQADSIGVNGIINSKCLYGL